MRAFAPLPFAGLLLAGLLGSLGCGAPKEVFVITPPDPPPEAPATAAQAPDRPTGPLAAARVITAGDPALNWGLGARPGDIWISNPQLGALVAGTSHRLGPSASGGAILHVERANQRTQARLGALIPVFDRAGQRAPVIESVVVQQDGAVGGPAVVHLEGYDPIDPKIRYAQDVLLDPGADALRVRAVVQNKTRNHIPDFHFGYLAEWGGLQPFVPGRTGGPEATTSDWVGASGPVSSLVLTLPIGRITGVHGAGWSVLLPKPLRLMPKQRAASELRIYPGTGGESTAVAALYRSRKAVAGSVAGTVNVPGAEVELLDATGAPVIRGTADAEGRYALVTRPGRMVLRARAPGRTPVQTQPFYVSSDNSAAVPVALGPASGLAFTIRDGETGLPARLLIRDAHNTPVWLADMQGAVRAGNAAISLTGSGIIPLPPGRYRVGIDAGPSHARADRGVTVSAGQMASLNVELIREVDPEGWYALDGEVLSPPGNDGTLVRAADCAAAGIDGMVLLGDGTVPGNVPRPQMFGGVALADPGVGWFAGFPLDATPPPQPVQALAAERLAALRRIKGALTAVLRPRVAGWGYFTTFRYSPTSATLPRGGFSLDFDLLQIATPAGGAPAVEAALFDYASLLRRGARVVPFGGSGARYRSGRCGVARTWLRRAPKDAADLRAALRAGDVVASFGPLIDLNVDGKRPGQAVTPAESHAVIIGIDAAAAHRPRRVRVFADGKVVAQKRLSAKGPMHQSAVFTIKGPVKSLFAAVDARDNPAAFAVTGPVRFK